MSCTRPCCVDRQTSMAFCRTGKVDRPAPNDKAHNLVGDLIVAELPDFTLGLSIKTEAGVWHRLHGDNQELLVINIKRGVLVFPGQSQGVDPAGPLIDGVSLTSGSRVHPFPALFRGYAGR